MTYILERNYERNSKMIIGNVTVDSSHPIVIAEAGVNHLGKIEYGRRLIEGAKQAGAKIIKFQTYKAEKLTTKNAPRFWNWEGETNLNGTQFDSYSILDKFGLEEYRELKSICQENDIEFMSTPFDLDSVELLEQIGVNAYKIASCDITNKSLLVEVARTGKPILMSTGASNISEIRTAINTIEKESKAEICIMHCNLCYPTQVDSANLSALNHLHKEFPDYLLGYSDHTLGIDVAAASVCFGSRVIEKHFTFDKGLPLSADHWLSADIDELTQLVKRAELLSKAFGINEKVVMDSEGLARINARRSIVTANKISKGAVIRESDLIMKRPGTGISPMDIDDVIGKIARVDMEEDLVISRENLI